MLVLKPLGCPHWFSSSLALVTSPVKSEPFGYVFAF